MARGFLIDRGETTSLLFPGANDTAPTGINDRAQVIGYYSTDDILGAFVYDRGVYSDFVYPIDVPPGFERCDYVVFGGPELVSINNKGQILGRFSATFVAPSACGVAPVTVNRLFIATPTN